jgi:hypothetical protein
MSEDGKTLNRVAQMGSHMRFRSSQRPCQADCPIKTAFSATPLQAQVSRHEDELRAANDSQMRKISAELYSPIKPWQTRILRLQPGQPGDPVVCNLDIAELVCFEGIGLKDQPELVEFEALSYSWGRPAFSASINCNGVQFPVTPNLAEALTHFRRPAIERLLWVDAFCINQFDLVEKAR